VRELEPVVLLDDILQYQGNTFVSPFNWKTNYLRNSLWLVYQLRLSIPNGSFVDGRNLTAKESDRKSFDA